MPARLGGDFWRPVSASKNSVPGAGLGANSNRIRSRNCDFRANVVRDVGVGLRLFRIESERLELPTPFSRRIAKPLNADATGQATFYGGFNKVGC
jgi:hypothetical protein